SGERDAGRNRAIQNGANYTEERSMVMTKRQMLGVLRRFEDDEEVDPDIFDLALGYFPVLGLHRDDLRAAGFDATNVSDETMARIAWKMDCNVLGFWDALPILAEHMEVPRLED